MKEPQIFKDSSQLRLDSAPIRVIADSRGGASRLDLVPDESGVHEFTYEVAPGAALEAVLFQGVSLHQEVLVRVRARLSKDSSLKLTLVQQGGAKSQMELDSELLGEGAELHIQALQDSKSNQKYSLKANAIHSVPHTRSDLQVWSVARDDSQSIFNGLITIKQTAPFTEAFQKNKNLILSEKATIDSFPKLLIANDNVKCAHGSSTSTLEPEQFYYLQARGIEKKEAEEMLIRGFMRQSLSLIGDELLRAKVEEKLGLSDEVWS